jgi:hypothetical protein
METPSPTAPPQPVLPVPPPSQLVTLIVAGVLLAALATGIYSIARPSIVIETSGDVTTYRVSPDSTRRGALLLALAVLSAIVLLRREIGSQLKWIGGVLLTVAIACFVPLWHQAECQVTVTPDTITAPLRGGLFPGAATAINFADLSDLYFRGENSGTRYQICRTKKKAEIELDMGPLFSAALEQVEANARAHSVHVWHSF